MLFMFHHPRPGNWANHQQQSRLSNKKPRRLQVCNKTSARNTLLHGLNKPLQEAANQQCDNWQISSESVIHHNSPLQIAPTTEAVLLGPNPSRRTTLSSFPNFRATPWPYLGRRVGSVLALLVVRTLRPEFALQLREMHTRTCHYSQHSTEVHVFNANSSHRRRFTGRPRRGQLLKQRPVTKNQTRLVT